MIDSRFFKASGPFSIEYIQDLIDCEVINCASLEETFISSVATLDNASSSDLSFFHNAKYLDDLKNTSAGAVFVTSEHVGHVPEGTVALIHPKPYRAYATIATYLYFDAGDAFTAASSLKASKDAATYIADDVELGEDVILEVGVVIKAGAKIGKGSRIGAYTVIGPGVEIGENARIADHVSLACCLLGKNVRILPGARIGQSGFGFHMDEQGHVSVPQLGRVLIGDFVEIGANVTIDRGALQDTIVGRGSRIDNMVQLGHGVVLGEGCVLVAQVGIAGSTKLGNYVIAAGQVGISGHLNIGDRVQIAAQAGLLRDVQPGERIAGTPAVPVQQWHRQTVSLARLAKTKSSAKKE